MFFDFAEEHRGRSRSHKISYRVPCFWNNGVFANIESVPQVMWWPWPGQNPQLFLHGKAAGTGE